MDPQITALMVELVHYIKMFVGLFSLMCIFVVIAVVVGR